jgi:hypothetical protein
MNFMDKFKNGWQLFLNSLDVMAKNKRLLLFPVATAALTFVMAGLFLTPIALQPTGHAYTEKAHWAEVGSRLLVTGPPTEDDLRHGRKESVSLTKQAYAYGILFYFLSMFLATFFNVAFTHEIFNALSGEPVTITDGLQFAGTKWKPILMWTMFAGLVGMIIRTLEEKFGPVGRFIIKMIGVAWSVAAVFVIPVLVMEEHPDNPIGVVRQSAGVIRKTWGEALAGYAGLQIGGLVIGFGTLAVVALSIALGFFLKSVGLTFAVLGLWFVFICAFSYAMSVASQIYLCVLYKYATSGTVPQGYTPEMLTMAWRPKKA